MNELARLLRTPWGVALSVTVVIAGFGFYSSTRQDVVLPDADGANPAMRRNQRVSVGGIQRPQSDVTRQERQHLRTETQGAGEHDQGNAGFDRYGRTPALSPDTNPAVASAYEALTTKQHPERLSVLLPPAKFDPAAYARDRQKYLDTYEPGRVWQTSQPGPGVPILTPLVSPRQVLLQEESVRLQVKAAPAAPVTFTSLDLGAFENRLPSITVAADESGVATATFTAPPGTVFRVNILASSPLASGQAQFHLWVQPPDGA